MQSTIQIIEPKGSWEGQFGKMYTFKVVFLDNETLEVNSKTETPPYKVGDVVDYEVTKVGKYGKQGKIKKAETLTSSVPGGVNRDLLIVRQSSLKAAVECNPSASPHAILMMAELFTQWVMEGQVTEEQSNVPF